MIRLRTALLNLGAGMAAVAVGAVASWCVPGITAKRTVWSAVSLVTAAGLGIALAALTTGRARHRRRARPQDQRTERAS